MKKFGRLYLLLALAMTAFLAVGTSAQGRYVNQYSRADVDDIIRRVETSGDEFRRDFRNELDRSNLSSSQKRTYNNQVIDFEKATDSLRNQFNNQNSWWQSRSQVQNVISNSRPLNQTMNGIGFRRKIERQWNQLRNDINRLADTYDLPGIAGGGWNGGPWNPGNPGNPGGGNPPSWAVGVFNGRHPEYGGTITLTIDRNGRVTSSYNGAVSYGTISGSNLYMEGVNARVTNINNGIRIRRNDTGETVNYYRSGGGGGDGGGNTSRPPSWAQGTFRGQDPMNGAEIVLTITSNGRVTSRSGRQVSYGTYYNDVITMEGVSVRVDKRNNGIRTTRTDTGQVVNYRR